MNQESPNRDLSVTWATEVWKRAQEDNDTAEQQVGGTERYRSERDDMDLFFEKLVKSLESMTWPSAPSQTRSPR